MKLNDEYSVSSFEQGLTLSKKKKTKKGDVVESVVGYYANIEQLQNSILQLEIRDSLGNFEKFYERTEELKQFITKHNN